MLFLCFCMDEDVVQVNFDPLILESFSQDVAHECFHCSRCPCDAEREDLPDVGAQTGEIERRGFDRVLVH